MRLSARSGVLVVTALTLVAATALSLGDMRLASSQTVTLVAKRTETEVPLDDPFAPVWNRATPVEAPLSAQSIVPPQGGGERTIKARALHDGRRLYILVEWKDDSADVLVSQQTEFTDAVAVQFPVADGESVPSFCMGDPSAPVNIWQWKAAWQSDIEQGYVDVEDAYSNIQVDLYPFEDEEVFYPARAAGNVFAEANRTTPVDNLLAGSYGTLTQAPEQVVLGQGQWRLGKWRVLFARELDAGEEYSHFVEGKSTNVAFAVWDGAKRERDGMKSVSQFMTLNVSAEIARPKEVTTLAIVLIVLGAVALVSLLLLLGRQRRGS